MEPITDVRGISRIAYGFVGSRALFAALDLDVFSRLSGQPKTLDALARESDIAANRLLALLTALVSVGLLEKDGEFYANAPASETFLVRGAPKDFGDYLRVVNGKFVYPMFTALEAALRGKHIRSDSGFYAAYYGDQERAEQFTRAQHAGSLGPAAVLARRIDLTGCRTLLDVGGGSGTFTITLCRRYPELAATILDFPQTVEVAKRYVAEAGLGARVGHLAGNAVSTEWPSGQDAVLMSYLWSAVSRDDIDELAKRAYTALAPGGLVLIHDFMVSDEKTGPPIAAWHLLGSTVDNPDAVCLTPSFVTERLSLAGFGHVSVEALIPGITNLATAHKPA